MSVVIFQTRYNMSVLASLVAVKTRRMFICWCFHQLPGRRQPLLLKRLKDRSDEKIPGASPEPSVRSLQQTKDSSLLQCLVRGAFPKPLLEWQDSAGNILPAEEHVTERDSKFDITLQTTVTKTDNYSCVSTQKELHHRVVAWTHEHFQGTVKPFITSLEETNEWSLLQCEVYGVSPKTKLQWKDSFQNVVPAKEPEVRDRGGIYDIILQTTVTKSAYYHCVSTQEETGLQTEAKIHVNIGGSSYGWIVAVVLSVVVLILLGIIFYCWKRQKKGKKTQGGRTAAEEAGLTGAVNSN